MVLSGKEGASLCFVSHEYGFSGKSEQLFLQTSLLAGSSINDEHSLIILLITWIVLAEKKDLQFSNTPFLLVCVYCLVCTI